jgi:competence protein ComEC
LIQIKEYLTIEKSRLKLFVPVILGVGIIVGVFFPFYCWKTLLVFLLISFSIFILVFKKSKILANTILIFSLGIYIAQTGGILKMNLLTKKQFVEKECNGVSFTAKISFVDETHPTMKNMRRITFQNIEFQQNSNLHFVKTAKMTCSTKMTENLFPNDIVKVTGKIAPYKSAAIPGAFDQLQYNALVGLDASGIVYNIKKLEDKISSISDLFSYLRCFLTKQISAKMRNPAGGVACALLTGDKSPITPDVREMFINSGTAHILAISGLHMSILASLLFFIFLKIFQYISCIFSQVNARQYAAITTAFLTFLYLVLSGFSPSATRAFIMTTIFLISIIFGKSSISLRSVAIAAFLILLFDAGALFLVSFQLSFCAVVALIAFYETFQPKLSKIRFKCKTLYQRFGFYVLASSITTLIASFATLPISIFTFNRLSLSGILGNLVAIPSMSFIIMPLGILSLITGYFFDYFVIILEYLLNCIVSLLGKISEIPGSAITIKSPNIFTLYTIVTGGIIICLLKTKIRLIGLLPIFFGSLIWVLATKPDVIAVPGENVICFIEDSKFYTTSLQKGRRKVTSIQRNLGFDGRLEKRKYHWSFCNVYEDGLFIWSKTDKIMKIARRKHPYCPAYFCSTNVDSDIANIYEHLRN